MKKKYVLILGILIGMIISASGVYAAETIIESINVSYDNTSSGGSYTNVQESIDELYEKSGLLKEKWVEKDLNGADPVLEVEGSTKKLIPITIDNDGTVHYANLYTKWYDYSDKKWANAVILVDNPKNGGDKNYTYKTGDIINENDIESYFVWIPRYSYKIWNLANTEEYSRQVYGNAIVNKDYDTSLVQVMNGPRIIDVKFGDVKTNPRMNESDATLDSYYTHPAFTLGNTDLNGIWVGKFETGYNQDGNNGESFTVDDDWTTTGADKTEENSKRIIVKPNVFSWRTNTLKNFFLSAYNYERDLESHMMKNTEWGAVAYLSHSAYGKGSEIRINNNLDYKTGYSATSGTDQTKFPGTAGYTNSGVTKQYNTSDGYLASTTGNITGIYDMSGGVAEYMASYVSGRILDSGFIDDTEITTIYKNYFDFYSADSSSISYNKRILGDATGEMGPFYDYFDGDGKNRYHSNWYGDLDFFNQNGWFYRGGFKDDGILAGIFYSAGIRGEAHWAIGMRLVLSP